MFYAAGLCGRVDLVLEKHTEEKEMRALEKLGGWVLNRGWLLLIVLGAIPLAVNAYTGGRTATVSSKEFVCTATSAIGIEPQCDQYTRVKAPVGLQ